MQISCKFVKFTVIARNDRYFMIARTPKPPYYAVIFTSIRSEKEEGYSEMSRLMLEEVAKMEGFLGVESASGVVGITVSYWTDIKAIKAWKIMPKHQEAQETGKKRWYDNYKVRIAFVERDYEFEK